MGITTSCLNQVSKMIATSGAVPSYMAIGISGLTFNSGNTTLGSQWDRNELTSINTTTAKQILYTADFSSTEMSGCTLFEYGLFNMATGGTMFHREVLGSIAFIGDTELQLQSTIKFV